MQAEASGPLVQVAVGKEIGALGWEVRSFSRRVAADGGGGHCHCDGDSSEVPDSLHWATCSYTGDISSGGCAFCLGTY